MTPDQARAWRRVVGAFHGVINAYEVVPVVPAKEPETGCPHPEDQQENVTMMGGPLTLLCRACQTTYTVPDSQT